MIQKKLKELYSVDTISQDKGWGKVLAAVEEIPREENEDIEIDLSGINVQEPWLLPNFQILISKPYIRLKFTNAADTVEHIKMMLIIDGMDVDRVSNIEIELPKEKSAAEKQVEFYGERLIEYFKIDGDTATFTVKEKYTQLQSSNTESYCRYAIDKINAEKGITNFIIDLDGISANNNVLELFAHSMLDYEDKGITLKLNITNEDNKKTMGLFMHKFSGKEPTPAEKCQIIKSVLDQHKDVPGILIKYKKSRKKDEFGRLGNGEAVMARIAILREIRSVNSDGGGVAVFDTYHKDYFFTKQHWMVSHDNQSLDSLVCDRMDVPISELGFLNEFTGSGYHFAEPVQQTKGESTKVIVAISDEGTNISKICTVAERMKYVFDDWDIHYDEQLLNEAIAKTEKHLHDVKTSDFDEISNDVMQEIINME